MKMMTIIKKIKEQKKFKVPKQLKSLCLDQICSKRSSTSLGDTQSIPKRRKDLTKISVGCHHLLIQKDIIRQNPTIIYIYISMIHAEAKFEEANFSPRNIFTLKPHQMFIHQIP
jgi:hypothetical protein